jgi:predicted MFS family arabinose efflux permease
VGKVLPACWGSPGIIALFALAVVSLVAFALLEPRVREPMVDFRFFRSRTFLGANVVAFIVTFAMLATFFFIALYMQNMLGYSAVEAGVRFLPATLMIVLIAPLAGRLTDKVGARPLMVAGLSLASLSLLLQTRIDVDTGYGLLLPSFILLGIGMALVMSPMSTAAMNAVSPDKAGVASGILSMSRMVGGTFGVAAIGALFQHLARNELEQNLAGTGVSAATRERIVENLGSGNDAGLGPQAAEAAHQAFIHALSTGMWLAAGVSLLGVLVALVTIVPHTAERPGAAPAEAAAEVSG